MRIGIIFGLVLSLPSCAFNFELTSQKTALENQVMGSYKELDDDVILMASVRGVSKDGKQTKTSPVSDAAKKAIIAKQNQDFNRDDIDELKERQVLGEASGGLLAVLPKEVVSESTARAEDLALAKLLVSEENRDRDVIVQRIVTSNENLTAKDLGVAKKTYQRKVVEDSPQGTWFQNDQGQWQRKSLAQKDQTP